MEMFNNVKLLLLISSVFCLNQPVLGASLDINSVIESASLNHKVGSLNFIENSAKALFYEDSTTSEMSCRPNCNNLVGILFFKSKKILLSVYNYEGGVPYIGKVFTYNVDRDLGNELIVQVIWKHEHKGIGLNAEYYKIYIYDNKSRKVNDVYQQADTYDIVMNEFKSGFDGSTENGSKVYEYKTPTSIKAKLDIIKQQLALNSNQYFESVIEKSYRDSFKNYKRKDYSQSVSILEKAINKKGLQFKYPDRYKNRYTAILNDYAFFIFKYYQQQAAEYCKYIEYSSEKERLDFRVNTLDKAKNVLKYVLELKPDRMVAYLNLGDVLYELDQDDAAIKSYQKYKNMMIANGKQNKIPSRIKNPLDQNKIHICK